MKKNKFLIFSLFLFSFILVACLSESKKEKTKGNSYEQENYLPIDEYNGEGFQLRNANVETAKIAEENRKEVDKAIKNYFLKEYQTEVAIKNIAAAVDGVSVYVKSIQEPYFNSFAVLPIDIKNQEVKLDRIRTEEGQVENGIKAGLYAMAFSKEFEKLDNFLEDFERENPILSTPREVVEKVQGNGYSNKYYFISVFDDFFDKLFDYYMDNPSLSKDDLEKFFNEHSFDPEKVTFAIEFYMDSADSKPDPEIIKSLQSKIEELPGIPAGEYYLFLNDYFIDKKRAIGEKENTIEKSFIKDNLEE